MRLWIYMNKLTLLPVTLKKPSYKVNKLNIKDLIENMLVKFSIRKLNFEYFYEP